MTTLLANKREISNLSAANVGDTLEFFYRGNGDHAFQDRKARVTEVQFDGILAEDLEFHGLRNFKNREASEVYRVDKNANAAELDFVDVRQKLIDTGVMASAVATMLTGEQLAELYSEYIEPEATGVEFNETTGKVLVTRTKPEASFSLGGSNASLDVITADGVIYNIDIEPGNNRVLFDNESVTPKQLAEKLSEITS